LRPPFRGKNCDVRAFLPLAVLIQVLSVAGVLVLVCIILFVAGVLRPGQARRMQDGVDQASMKAEEKSDQSAGPFGDVTGSSLQAARKTADKSAEAGREAHDKLTS
jgi:hypothetical protein